jgi:hypothetical protein
MQTQASQTGVVGGTAAGAPGHAEGDEPCGLEGWRIGEEGIVGRIGTGPAALDVVDPEIVQRLGDGEFVGHVEVDALSLRPVAQGRIE